VKDYLCTFEIVKLYICLPPTLVHAFRRLQKCAASHPILVATVYSIALELSSALA